MTLGFVVLAYALAFWQQPGQASSDTKIDLHVIPGRFLADVASVWTPTTDLGEVHSAQYSGYLWPMGPFYAALHGVGLSPWVVQRLWLGTMLALAAWGLLRLLDDLVGRSRGVVHLVATAFFIVNPYVVVFSARTTITLLGYAALPWLLLAVHRGVPDLRGLRAWWWPAAFALIFTSTGGGVNAAVVGWMCVGPGLLLLYEPLAGHARWRGSLLFLLRAGGLAVLASLWWILPLLVHVRYGIDFLQFTEQPRSIWGTNSITESLRLMGYWTSYIGVGYGVQRPFFSDGPTMLFDVAVVGASLLLPAIAVGGFAVTRRARYAPFFVMLVVVGVVVMAAGFPEGTPLRHVMEWVYRNIFVLRFMRTTNKAAPLVALGAAGLLGLLAQLAWARVGALAGRARSVAIVAAPAALLALILLAALPLVRGGALDDQLLWNRIPAAWKQAGHDLDRELPQNTRAVVLPGQIFAYYDWGGTLDPILPRLSRRPVAVRYETAYSDLHAVDLLWTVDALVQQRRLLPGQLKPLLGLMGASAVVTGTDDDRSRSGAIDPVSAAQALRDQGLGAPARSYGPVRALRPAAGELGAPARLPQVRRYDVGPGRGMVHVRPVGPATVLDGSAAGLAGLAALGGLHGSSVIRYAGDLPAAAIRRQAERGGEVVVTDTNRRQILVPQFSGQTAGATLPEDQPIDRNAAVVDPFPKGGTAAQTVAVLRGARALFAPSEPGAQQFPEHRPYAAFDGDPSTAWLADRFLDPDKRWLRIDFERPTDVPYVDLLPFVGRHGVVKAVEIGGHVTPIGRGWTRVRVGGHALRSLRIRVAAVRQPDPRRGSAGGLREIRIPGVHVRELLRPPVVAARALAGRDLRRVGLSWLFQRVTADDPLRRDVVTADSDLGDPRDATDPEPAIDRLIFSPAARRYAIDGLATVAPGTSDADLDRLAGVRGGVAFTSSGRFHGTPSSRASSAFDTARATSWMGLWIPSGAAAPWIAWRTPAPRTLSRLTLTPAAPPARRPTAVRVSWPGGSTGALPVGPGGVVALPGSVRAPSFRVTVVSTAPQGDPRTRAVGLRAVTGPGVPVARVPRSGALRTRCGDASIRAGGATVALSAAGSVADLDAGRPLRLRSCGPVAVGAGVQEVSARHGTLSVDVLRLGSPAPSPVPVPPAGDARLTDSGSMGRSGWDGVRISLRRPSWLVLGESFDVGWRATCDGRALGAPQVVDGYANGWIAPAGCRRAAFSFAPQAGVAKGYAVSAVVCALLAAYLLAFAPRRRRREPVLPPWRTYRPAPIAPGRAAALALLIAAPLGLIFALRAGLVLWPLLTVVLWRGIGPRTLALVAGGLLGVVVPLIYLLDPPRDEGGYRFAYGVELIGAHWVGVAAVVLLGVAGWRTLAAGRRSAASPEPPTPHVAAYDGDASTSATTTARAL